MKKILFIALLSAFTAMAVVSYTSWWQIQNLSWLREFIYFEDTAENPCQDQFQGYGRLYKDGCFVSPVSVVQSVGDTLDKVHQGINLTRDEEETLIEAVDFLTRWSSRRKDKDDDEFLVAQYHFSWDKYDLEPGWISGMAQGHIIEALVAVYEITNDESYLKTAESFANAFYVPVENGGVTVWTDHGPWFEEYAQAGKEPSYALNGHVFAVEGLYRLAHYSPEYKRLVYQAVEATEGIIDQFNIGWWSRYDLRGTLANQKYHHIHVRQLHWLGIEFGSEKLDYFGQKFLWAQFYPVSSVLRAFIHPTRFLGFILVLNFISFAIFFYCIIYIYRKFREKL